MRSYLMVHEIQPKAVLVSVSRLEARIPHPQYPDPTLRRTPTPVEMTKFDVVSLHPWWIGRSSGGGFTGRMGYHAASGTVVHTDEFPVWEWLLIEILANLAEQFRRAAYTVTRELVAHRMLRLIWWLSEGVPMDDLLTPDEQVEWDRKWAPLWAESQFRCPTQLPDYTRHIDVLWDFDRIFGTEAA